MREASQSRRRHRRVEAVGRCWCESGSITIYARLGNVSEGGVFVKTSAPLPEGARTRVRCALDAGRDLAEGPPDVDATAVVVWRRQNGLESGEPSGMGLRFDDVGDTSLEVIRALVAVSGEGTGEG